tara:strand:- start:230 stop:583 length:354 start_codon:yes stop_codon:yes gene_type:complete
MKAKVIEVKTKSEHIKFNGYVEYEVTLLNEDQTVETMPVYGKDLQHALSRIVKLRKKENTKTFIENVPVNVWVVITLAYLVLVTIPTEITKNPVILIAGLALICAVLVGVKLYINKK